MFDGLTFENEEMTSNKIIIITYVFFFNSKTTIVIFPTLFYLVMCIYIYIYIYIYMKSSFAKTDISIFLSFRSHVLFIAK